MRTHLDRGLVLSILFMCGLGLVQVYSSSFIFAIESYNDGLFFVIKQLLFVFSGLMIVAVVAYLPTRWLIPLGVLGWLIAVVAVSLTLFPGLGVKVGGAKRWLNLGGGFRLEPSEILKYATPFIAAISYYAFNEKTGYRKFFWLLLPFAPVAVILKQPDFGSAVIICTVLFMLLFALGLQWRYIIVSLGAFAGAVYYLVLTEKYRMARIAAFLDPWSDPAHKGFQVIQSMLGFYSGGLTGVGIGQGQGKLFFLPEAHTDFTLSVLGEEWGFVGMLLVFMIFGYMIMRGLQISARAHEGKYQIIALGITLTFAFTVIINCGVAMGLLPTKGLGVPFLSYGGSALIATCVSLGVLLNIDRANRMAPAKPFSGIKIHK